MPRSSFGAPELGLGRRSGLSLGLGFRVQGLGVPYHVLGFTR